MLISKVVFWALSLGIVALSLACSADGYRNEKPLDLAEPPGSKAEVDDSLSSCKKETLGSIDVLSLPVAKDATQRNSAFIAKAEAALVVDPDLNRAQRSLTNYVTEVRETSHFIFILFSPKISGGNPPDGGGETDIGRDVLYTLCKTDGKLIDRKFFK